MDQFIIEGPARLAGDVRVSGSKNSSLALMTAALLADGVSTLRNVPQVRDVDAMLWLLNALGATASRDHLDTHVVRIDGSHVKTPEAPYELVRQMRASFMVLGPLLAKHGLARVSEPGGCSIGVRPIDQHLKGLEALGAQVTQDHGYIEARAERLVGRTFSFDLVTVNGTQNVMMAASLAEGETVLENAAREPEVVELAQVLRKMGAHVVGEGTSRIVVQGVQQLEPMDHAVAGDRIEAGTLLAAGAVCEGDVTVSGIDPGSMGSTLDKFREAGVNVETGADWVRERTSRPPSGAEVMTAPFPGFPTDMQAQVMALLALAEGSSVVTENVFENRFMHVSELRRMGADITVSGRTAHVRGVERLSGAPVMATDLRASAGLLVAGLAAQGSTTVHRVYHIDRGYERIEEKLRKLGADIRREEE